MYRPIQGRRSEVGQSEAITPGHVRTDCEGICPARRRSRECIDSAIAFECIDSEAVSRDRKCRPCVVDAECVDCQVFEARSVESSSLESSCGDLSVLKGSWQ